ncbi:hypothetical protein [Marinococcus sp. PL1-022]|uniref:hypothetical protein n=1 Tax=Marinococcus sp. PL1-022 TaxID=3095363 RepID=UPI0029C18FB2|nr:hypothetical protein [Marinococcus sp. PL1-022]MDX6152707.1 hypothetical protein [Marinococcus sp. PL1-022]
MTGSQISSILSYISVFFAPVFVPLIVLIAGNDYSRPHALRALLSHLLPTIMILAAGFWAYLTNGAYMYSNSFWLFFSLVAIVQIAIMILNVLWALRVASDHQE